MIVTDELIEAVKQDEGLRLTVYTDSVGVPTIGYGHNLNVPISEEIAEFILTDDLHEHVTALTEALPWIDRIDRVRQNVLANMAFNLGVPGLLKFTNTLQAVKDGRYQDAADGMVASRWYHQVGARAQRLVEEMRSGNA